MVCNILYFCNANNPFVGLNCFELPKTWKYTIFDIKTKFRRRTSISRKASTKTLAIKKFNCLFIYLLWRHTDPSKRRISLLFIKLYYIMFEIWINTKHKAQGVPIARPEIINWGSRFCWRLVTVIENFNTN